MSLNREIKAASDRHNAAQRELNPNETAALACAEHYIAKLNEAVSSKNALFSALDNAKNLVENLHNNRAENDKKSKDGLGVGKGLSGALDIATGAAGLGTTVLSGVGLGSGISAAGKIDGIANMVDECNKAVANLQKALLAFDDYKSDREKKGQDDWSWSLEDSGESSTDPIDVGIEKIDKQRERISAVSGACRKDKKSVEDLKGGLVAGNIGSGVSLAGGITSTATSAASIIHGNNNMDASAAKKADAQKTQSNLRLAAAIGSGASAAGSIVSTATFGATGKKIDDLISGYDACFEALEKVDTKGW